jgi:hypothetical protein
MLSIANHIGFNINNNSLQLVEVVRESSKYCLENVDEHIFDTRINFKELKFIPILQAALEKITNRTPLKSSNISISLPINELLFFEIFYDGSLSEKALNDHVEWEFSVLFPEQDVKNYLLRSIKLKNNDNQKKMLVIAAPTKLVKELFTFAKKNNFKLKYVDNSHFSSDLNIIVNENKTTLSVYIDYPFVSLNSYIGKNLSATNTIHIENRSEQATRIIDFMEKQNIVYDKIYMASSVENDEFKFEMEERLQKKIELINPFEFIPTSESFIQNAHFMNKPNTFSAAAGICFRKF